MASTPNYPSSVFTSVGTTEVIVSGECEVDSIVVYGAASTDLTIKVDNTIVADADWASGKRMITGARSGDAISLTFSADSTASLGNVFPRYLKDGTVVSQLGGDSIVMSGLKYE